MKYYPLLILFFIIGCALEQLDSDKPVVASADSIKHDTIRTRLALILLDEVHTLRRLLALANVKDSVRDGLIDSYQKEILKNQSDIIRLHGIQIQLRNFTANNRNLLAKLEALETSNSNLSVANIEMSDKLKNTTIALRKAKIENDEYKKENKFKIANVKLSAWGYVKKVWYKKAELDTVSTAKHTLYLEVTFIVPANDKLQKTTYTVNVRIRGVNGRGINKDIKILFNGTEQDNLFERFDDPEGFQVGYHHADITLDNENLYSGSIYLR